jgi:hypothetical protein
VRVDGRVVGASLLVLGIVAAFVLRGTSSGDSPEHRTDSDAANGASALVQLAGALGHPTATMTDAFQPDPGLGALFVLSPTVAFTRDEATRSAAYVAEGGVLVYAAAQGDGELDLALQVGRQQAIARGDATGAGPALVGVSHVVGATTVQPLAPTRTQTILLRSATGGPIAVEQFVGRGRAVVLADPLPLCNGYLQRADDGRLAADLVSLAPAGSRVAFDEYHHAGAGSGSPLTGWLSTAWGAATVWAALAGFVFLLLRGRAFGPRRALPGGGHRSAAEYVAAVGGLLARSNAELATGRLLVGAARRALAARHGIALGPGFDRALRQRAPAQADELERAAADVGRDGADALLAAARRLHHLAYPDEPSR